MQETYSIKLEQFEGPFDLLLFFIQRDELDIYDIPIAKITDDFLNYIYTLDELNINVASEFILMASTLIRIKSKMLLPRKELDDSGNIVDPRTDLVSQLIEYKKIKSVLTELETLEENRSKIHLRGNNSLEFKFLSDYYGKNAELEPVPIYKLFSVFRSLLSKMEDNKKVLHSVNPNKYKIEDQKILILNVFQGKKKVDFKNVFVSSENRMHAVVIFLSLLEMLTDGIVGLLVGLGKNNFWVTRK